MTSLRHLCLAIALVGMGGIWCAGLAEAGDRYALLIGVLQYDPIEFSSLEYPENDVTQLAGVLLGSGYQRGHVVLMTQSVAGRVGRGNTAQFWPTGKNIRRQLAELLKKIKEEDSLVVAFSGHGVQFKGEDDSWFCPTDAELGDRKTLLSLTGIYEQLKGCRAQNKLLLVDACRNDPAGAKSADKPLPKTVEVDLGAVGGQPAAEPPGGVTAFFSCSRGERSFEHQDLQGGVFLHFVAQGLEGDADVNRDKEVTLSELQEYTVENVQKFVATKLRKSQLPELRGEIRGRVALADVNRPLSLGEEPTLPPAPMLSPDEKALVELDVVTKQLAAARLSLNYNEQQIPALDQEIRSKKLKLAELTAKNAKLDDEIAYHREALHLGYYVKPKVRSIIPREREGIIKIMDGLKAEKSAADQLQNQIRLAEGNLAAKQAGLKTAAARIEMLQRREAELRSTAGIPGVVE